MKKVVIFLVLLVSGVYTHAQKDTIFARESELVNDPIKIGIPDSIINSKATITQNGEAYYLRKNIFLYETFSRKYNFPFDEVTHNEMVLYFNKDTGRNEIRNLEPIRSNSEFSWFTFSLGLLFFLISVFMQKDVLKASLQNAPRGSLVLLAFVTWGFPFTAFVINTSSCQDLMLKLTFYCATGVLILFYVWRLAFKDYKRMRDTHVVVNVIIFIILLFFSLTRTVAISALVGLLLGLLSIYFWKSRKNKKIKKETNGNLPWQVYVPPRVRS